jgi:hypothetical protein
MVEYSAHMSDTPYERVLRSIEALGPQDLDRLITELTVRLGEEPNTCLASEPRVPRLRYDAESLEKGAGYGDLIEEVCQNLSEIERRTWLRMLEGGHTIAEIAREEKVTHAAIIDRLRRMALKNAYAAIWFHLNAGVRQRRRSLLELRGLGKDIWQDVDVSGYVNGERSSWSG